MVLVGSGLARHLSVGLGLIYPLYMSTEALRSGSPRDLQQWVTFWVVSALLTAAETVGDAALGCWLPFYYEAKLALLAWLVLPAHRGALVVHDTWLSPLFQRHERAIDAALRDARRRAGDKILQTCRETAAGAVAQSQQYVTAHFAQQALLSFLSSPVAAALKAEETTPATASKTLETVKRHDDKKIDRKAAKAGIVADEDTRRDKTRKLVDHFKKMLLKGFPLQYMASKGVIKQRLLRLDDTDARFITFVSSKDTTSGKAARLLLVNIARVSSSVETDANAAAELLADVDAARAFSIDNGKGEPMIFQAESVKSRDLLVAGLRLLVAEHKQRRGQDSKPTDLDDE